MDDRGVPLFKRTLKGELRQGARARRKMLELLDESKEPLPPFRLTKLLVKSSAYPGNPRPKTKASFVRKALEGMESRGIVEMAGEVPAGKGGTQKTYKLTPLGRVVASFAPTKRNLSEEEAVLLEQELREGQDLKIVEFVHREWKRENFFADFAFNVMLEVIKEGASEGVRKLFERYVALLCEGPLVQPGGVKKSDWVEMWISSMEHSEDLAYAKSVLKVLRTLPEERKGPETAYLKRWIENNYLESLPPSADYIRAIEEGGESVHVRQACSNCDFTNVLTESVERHFKDIVDGFYMAQARCPKCGSVLVTFK